MARTKGAIVITDELFEDICNRIASDESLSSICKDSYMPEKNSFWQYMNVQNSRSDEKMQYIKGRYAQARQASADSILEQIREIEDSMKDGKRNDKMGSAILASMKWRAKVMNPGVYGDKATLDHTGAVASTIQIVDYSSHSPVKQAQSDPGQVKPIAHPTPNDESYFYYQ